MADFRSSLDTLLPADTVEVLGRLLIDYQQLESVVRSVVEGAFAPVDPLGVIADLWTKGMTTNRKIDSAKELLDRAATRYNVSEVQFNGMYPMMVVSGDAERANGQVAAAFAGMRAALSLAGNLLSYRNDLFHGAVKVEGSEIRFVGRKPGQIPATAEDFLKKRQEVLGVVCALLRSAHSLHCVLLYLVAVCAQTGQWQTTATAKVKDRVE